jgi:uncharacterized protein (DUF1697 family)
MKYVALLRGINVGGNKTIRMADLKACFVRELGYRDAITHLNSGNVLFGVPGGVPSNAALEEQIGARLERSFFAVEVVVRSAAEMKEIAESGPFAGSGDSPEITRYVTFFKRPLTPEQHALIEGIDNPGETHGVIGTELYSELDRSQSRNLVFSGNFIDRQLKSIATTRNWRVVRKLAEMLSPA